jgi:sigma-E factor negative regulatory protein RseB
MASRSSPEAGGPRPGTDPVALRLISVAVLAGLLMTGAALATRAGLVPGRTARPSRAAAVPLPATVGSLRLGQAAGLRLLSQAAQACHSVSYQGVEVAWWGAGGGASAAVDVWHQGGGEALTRSAVAAVELPGQTRQSALFASGAAPNMDGAGVLDMSSRLVSLLAANYALAVTGWGQVADRPARMVTVRRRDGSLAAWFWLDSTTNLPLRREMFDSRARMISDVAFSDVLIGDGAAAGVPGPAARPWRTTLTSAQLTGLRRRGWPLPVILPGGLSLLGARQTSTGSGPVVDLDYSDGLAVVSVFVQRGHLPARLGGWSQVALEGHRVYTGDRDDLSFAWSARGFVYTVIAAAPRQTVGQVVSALPHDDPAPGLFTRMRHGLDRLLAWLTP